MSSNVRPFSAAFPKETLSTRHTYLLAWFGFVDLVVAGK